MNSFQARIETISWDRIYLSFRIKFDVSVSINLEKLEAYLVNSKLISEVAFNKTWMSNNELLISVNITNTGVNRCIPNGDYFVLIADDGSNFGFAQFLGSEKELTEYTRCFRYNNDNCAYTVTFALAERYGQSTLVVKIRNLRKEKLSHIPSFQEISSPKYSVVTLLGDNTIQRLKFAFKAIIGSSTKNVRFLAKLVYTLLKNFRLGAKKRILFYSAQQDTLAANMECLYSRMLERKLDKQFLIYLSLQKATSEAQPLWDKIKAFLLICLSDVIIVDDHVPWFDWLLLDQQKTKLIQIWHAGAGFKGVGFSRWGHLGCPGPFNCHRQYTYCISDSSKIAHFFSEQFGINLEQVIPTGMPRLDKFLDAKVRSETVNNLYKQYPGFKNRQIILFAPTYRGKNRAEAHYPYDLLDFQELYQYCLESNAVILFKMHPWVRDPVPIPEAYSDCLLDFSAYKSINELFYIVDLLITDYSSSMYEYALLNKPMIAFAYDKEQYSSSRGFHRDYDSNVPGKICFTFEALMRTLREKDYQFDKHTKYLENHFDLQEKDQLNSDKIIDWLILDQMPEQFKQALESHYIKVKSVRGRSFAWVTKFKSFEQ